eukprot:scaffold113669_cov75-Phaeocystis_antarctica.AAC.3
MSCPHSSQFRRSRAPPTPSRALSRGGRRLPASIIALSGKCLWLGLAGSEVARAPQPLGTANRQSNRGASWTQACSGTDCQASRAAHPAPRGPIKLLSEYSEPEYAFG